MLDRALKRLVNGMSINISLDFLSIEGGRLSLQLNAVDGTETIFSGSKFQKNRRADVGVRCRSREAQNETSTAC
jgi:hypothetical protein